MPTTLLLVRHGETDDNFRGVFQGQTGRGLNARGRAQCASLAARLDVAGADAIDAVYCSDLLRAIESAEILGARLGKKPEIDPDLREVHLGAWQGKDQHEVEAAFPEQWAAWRAGFDVRRGGGETYAELRVRVTRAARRVLSAREGRAAVIVSHGGAIKSFVSGFLDLGARGMRALGPLANGSVTMVTHADDLLRLVVWNDVMHIGDPIAAALTRPR